MAIQSLFGPTPAEIQELRRQQEEKEILSSGEEFGVFAPLYRAGLRFGAQGRRASASLLGASDPMLQKATGIQSVLAKYQGQDINSPEVMQNIANDLRSIDPEASLRAAQMARTLAPKRDIRTADGAIVDITDPRSPQVLYQSPDKEAGFKPSTNFGEVAQELGFGAKTDLNQYTPAQTAAVNALITKRKEDEQRAGVPQPGQVDITTISKAQDVVDQYIKGPSERLSNIEPLRTQLKLAKQGNGAAFEQVRGQLIKLVGDSQISNAERSRITGGSGIIEDAVNRINTLFTGLPTQDKLNEIERIAVAFEDVYGNQFNRARDKAETVLNQSKLATETRAALLPSRYVSGAEKAKTNKVTKAPAVGTIQNGYRFKGGNPADKNNWELVR